MADTKLSQLTLKTGNMVASDLVEITEGGNTTKSVTGTKILGLVSTSGNAATVTNGVYTVGTQNIGGDKTFGDDVTITGDLTVNGTTTTIDTTNLTVSDPLVKFGQDYIGSAYDQGFVVTRGNGSATNTANRGFIWDETADEFVAIACNTEDGTTAGNVTINSYVDMQVAKLTGSSLDISGDVDVDGTLEADAITLNGTALGSLYSPIAGGSGIVTTGALNSGSITSGFGTINNGSSSITTTGALGAGAATFGGNVTHGSAAFVTLTDYGTNASSRIITGGTNTATAYLAVAQWNGSGYVNTVSFSGSDSATTFAGAATVNGGLNVVGTNNTTSTLLLSNTAGTDNNWSLVPAYNAQTLSFLADSTTVLTLNEDTSATFAGQLQYVGASAGLYGTSSGTADNTIRLNNTNNTTYIGSNGSAGNRFSGSTAYFTTLGTTSAYGLELATNNTVRMSINSAGNATFANTVDVNNLKIGGAQGTDGQVLTSTGSGVAWEAAAGGSGDGSFSTNITQTKSEAQIIQNSTSYVANTMAAATANWAYTRMKSGSTFYDLAVNTGDASGAFQIRPAGSATNAFKISTAGDATVNGSVTATSFVGNVTGSSGSCTGNAATATNATTAGGLAVGTNANTGANQITRTNSAGYLNTGWINTVSGAASGTPVRIYCSQDAYIRYYTPAQFAPYILNQGSTKNSHVHDYLPLSGGTMTGDTIVNNYGIGNVGLYSSTKFQAVFSMGNAYKLPANGSSSSNLYGIAWTHTNVGNSNAKSGLGHQALFMTNGATQTAIGTGIWSIGNITAYSDISVKTNLERIPNALEKVGLINGYTYDRTDFKVDELTGVMPEIRQAGVVAQEIEKVLPEVVSGEDGNKSVAYGNIVALLIESIKELNAKVDSLQKQLEDK